MMQFQPLEALPRDEYETITVLRRQTQVARMLAELKGAIASIPNQHILINALALQEAKDSSAIENIVTTNDDLFREGEVPEETGNPEAKEVYRYRQALRRGYDLVRSAGLLTCNHIVEVHGELGCSIGGFRKTPGTVLKDSKGEVVYTPPQNYDDILTLMRDLERFVNDDSLCDADPLVKMALIHHRFESIHPFHDGNGRTGRIVNVLYLVKQGLLAIPALYLSRHIIRTRPQYYELLRSVNRHEVAVAEGTTLADKRPWEQWVLYMLDAVESTAREAIVTITGIRDAMEEYSSRIRTGFPKFHSQDLVNNLFFHPYTKIALVMQDLGVSRLTASSYLEQLTAAGLLLKSRMGRTNYYMNHRLWGILTTDPIPAHFERVAA